MLELKEKILSDGEIIEPDILKVDSFIIRNCTGIST